MKSLTIRQLDEKDEEIVDEVSVDMSDSFNVDM